MKKIYYFDENNEFTSEGFTYIDPLESQLKDADVYLLPPSATFEAPPAKSEGYAIVWSGEEWQLIPDYRGVEYWLPDDTYHDFAHVMRELGELPEGAILTRPERSLDEVKASKIQELKNYRNTEEESPILYKGKLWDFDSKSRDRINAAATALEVNNIESIEWTANDDTSMVLTVHDLKSIVSNAALRGDALHSKYRTLRDTANAATSIEEINAVQW